MNPDAPTDEAGQPKQTKRRWPQFTPGGLFMVVTIVCIKTGIESYQWRSRRVVVLRIAVTSPIVATDERQLHYELSTIDGASMILIQDRVINLRVHAHEKAEVLKVIRRHGYTVSRVEDLSQ